MLKDYKRIMKTMGVGLFMFVIKEIHYFISKTRFNSVALNKSLAFLSLPTVVVSGGNKSMTLTEESGI